MSDLDDLYEEIEARTNEGEDLSVVISDVAERNSERIRFDFERKTADKLSKKFQKQWAEPACADDPEQLTLDLGEHVFRLPDWKVQVHREDGTVVYIPAKLSTAEQRQDSHEARIQHHNSWARRIEAEHARDREQTARMASLGIDVSQPWDALRHRDTRCWRCGLGWIKGNPFERGHSDAPKVQGGTVTEWEHRSCNRSSRDNPVARPLDDTDA